MGIITISLNDRIEKELRRIAKARFHQKKGALGRAISEALEEWAAKRNGENIAKSLDLLEKGLVMGKLKSKREEWHER